MKPSFLKFKDEADEMLYTSGENLLRTVHEHLTTSQALVYSSALTVKEGKYLSHHGS
jgi:hypothetical protein